MSTASAPLEIGRVALVVNDIGRVGSFYKQALGLTELSNDGETLRLGAGDKPLLELRADKTARRRSPKEAGLFHAAFLLPSRADLGAWLLHASDSRLPLEGASDHLVSEAIYLSDRIVVLGGKPATIIDVIEVDFPKPRYAYDVRAEPRFAEFRARLRRELFRGGSSLAEEEGA